MFLKRGKGWSVTGRLTFFYAASTFALLSVVTGFLYFLLVGTMRRDNHESLVDELLVLRSLLKEHADDADALEEEILWESYARGSHPLFARVLEESGVTLIETPGMDKKVPPAAFPAPIASDLV